MIFDIASLLPGALIQTGALGTWLDFNEFLFDLTDSSDAVCMKEKTIFFVISLMKYSADQNVNWGYRILYVYSLDYERFGVITIFNDKDSNAMIHDWVEIK